MWTLLQTRIPHLSFSIRRVNQLQFNSWEPKQQAWVKYEKETQSSSINCFCIVVSCRKKNISHELCYVCVCVLSSVKIQGHEKWSGAVVSDGKKLKQKCAHINSSGVLISVSCAAVLFFQDENSMSKFLWSCEFLRDKLWQVKLLL